MFSSNAVFINWVQHITVMVCTPDSVTASIGPRASIGYGDWHMTVGPIGSRNAMTTAVYNKERGLRWWVGCQHGISTEALLERIKSEHGGNKHGDDYRAAISYVQSHPGLARAMAEAEAKTE